MNQDIKESDWKVFRQIHPIALERYFQHAVAGLVRIAGNDRKTNRERFWDVCDRAKKEQKEVADLFDDYRRSTARLKLAVMRREGWVREEEMSRFSPELQGWVKGLLELSNPKKTSSE
ncbi:MAG TPA: hypothetical protein VGN88_10785 [Phycisphaerae bacterium]|jgi:hypothetical protein